MHSHLSGPQYPSVRHEEAGQHVTIIPLRDAGKKKRCEPETGYLVVEAEPNRPEIVVRRARSAATLYRSKERQMGGRPPLFDPEIVHWDARGIYLQGWECSADGVQHVQVWLVVTCPVIAERNFEREEVAQLLA